MQRQYIKTKACGCVVKAIMCDIKNTSVGKMYILGSHNHLSICDICKKTEDRDEDTLRDMWLNDYMTNDFMYADWKQYDAE